jgi:hypothetical protein
MKPINEMYVVEGVDATDPKSPGAVRIIEGDFEGVKYQYGEVKFIENDDGTCGLKFRYAVHDNPNDANTESSEFIEIAGLILTEMIDEILKEAEETNISFDDIEDDAIIRDRVRELKEEQDKERSV